MEFQVDSNVRKIESTGSVDTILRDALGGQITDFVSVGLKFTVDWEEDSVEIGGGKAYIKDNGGYVSLSPETTEVDLHPGTQNYIYLILSRRSSGLDSFYRVTDVERELSFPYIKIGTVDTGSNTIQELNRRAALSPDKFGNDIDADGNDITNVGAFSSEEIGITDVTITYDTQLGSLVVINNE